MPNLLKKFFIFLIFVASNNPAFCQTQSQRNDAINLVTMAQQFITTNGIEKAMIEFNREDSPFNSKSKNNPFGDLYLFGTNKAGVQVIHGKNSKMRGKDLINIRDANGVYFIQKFNNICFSSATGKGWVDYFFPNPSSGNVGKKAGYVERVSGQDLCIGTGIYK